jgi:hypothetical protein
MHCADISKEAASFKTIKERRFTNRRANKFGGLEAAAPWGKIARARRAISEQIL